MNARAPRPAVVRITAGRWKGRRLEAPPGARPTSERARQALFDAIHERLPGSSVLDLFAGSGAVGLEAVSRGAARAVLVERDDAPLRRSLARISAAPPQVVLRAQESARAVEELILGGESFDLVFADPPYALPLEESGVGRAGGLLSAGGLVVLQRDAGDPRPAVEGLRHLAERSYGRNVFHFFDRL